MYSVTFLLVVFMLFYNNVGDCKINSIPVQPAKMRAVIFQKGLLPPHGPLLDTPLTAKVASCISFTALSLRGLGSHASPSLWIYECGCLQCAQISFGKTQTWPHKFILRSSSCSLTTTAYRWYEESETLCTELDRNGVKSSFMGNATLVLSFTCFFPLQSNLRRRKQV